MGNFFLPSHEFGQRYMLLKMVRASGIVTFCVDVSLGVILCFVGD